MQEYLFIKIVVIALIAWGVYALKLRAYKRRMSLRSASNFAEEKAALAACEVREQASSKTIEKTKATGRASIPWGTIVFVVVIWIVSHYSFNTQMMLLPFIGIALLVMMGLFLARASVYHSKPTQKDLADKRKAFVGIWVVIFGVVGMIHGGYYLRRRIQKTMRPLISAIDSYHAKTGHYPSHPTDIPDYIEAMPKCPGRGLLRDVFYLRKQPYNLVEDGYIMTCNTFLFMKYTYDSERKSWHEWD